MLLGFFVSLLIPETKGITLEELAGEEPTSYDSGRNGSIGASAPVRPWWLRFFRGGQPAGFFISRHRRASSGGGGGGGGGGVVGGRNPRVDIMASPELAAQQQRLREEAKRARMNGRRLRWKGGGGSGGSGSGLWRKTKRPESGESRGYAASSVGSTAGMMPEHAGVLPGWGVGWGRVDRGGNPIAMENIRLQDVGSLLR